MLDVIGCKPKVVCISGETDERILSKQGKILGIAWDPTADLLQYKLTVNISEKKGGARMGPDMSEDDLAAIRSTVYTRRICLGAAQQNFDPVGMITAYSVKLKLLMKEIIARDLTWEDQ